MRLTQIFLGTMDDAYALPSGVLAAAEARPDLPRARFLAVISGLESRAGASAVEDVAVIGVPDDEFGTRLRAFIVRAEDTDPTPDEIKAHVKTHLARYKVPRDVVFVDELPRNPTGKLVRRLLPTGPL